MAGAPSISLKWLALGLAAMFLTGCFYTFNTARYLARTGDDSVPWWCQGTPDLTVPQCQQLSVDLDFAVAFAHSHWYYNSALGAPSA